MSTPELKSSILELVNSTKNNKILSAIYDILLSDNKEDSFKLSSVQKKELDRRIENHKSGKSKSYSWEEVKRNIRK